MRRIPYDPNYLCFITTVTDKRRPIFRDPKLAERLGTMIHMACRLKGFVPLVYAILPDHLHLLVCSQFLVRRTLESVRRTKPERCSGTSFVRNSGGLSSPPEFQPGALIKSIKGTFSRTLPSGTVWKRRYHCWMISDARDAARVVEYITYNHRHSGVPKRYGQEPFVWRDDTLFGQLLS